MPAVDSDTIMRRLMQLDHGTCIRYRNTFSTDDPRRWYVSIPNCTASHPNGGFGSMGWGDGPTPQAALQASWKSVITHMTNDPRNFLLRYTCPNNVPIPGDTPQAWVRWSIEHEEWIDVEPTPEALGTRRIPRDRVLPYNSAEIQSERL
ncbi:MAG: hypothetical protein AAB473_01335 [Patescibacteria group bacterium]